MGAERHPSEYGEPSPAIGLATLTMDRFVSLDAGEQEGEVTSRPISVADQTKLLLNAVVNPGGSIAVELLDGSGSAIEGFARSDAIPFVGNAVFHPVSWRDKEDLRDLGGQMIRVRIIMRKARLYAFRLCQPDAAASDLAAIIC
jgi:hypothetical protein